MSVNVRDYETAGTVLHAKCSAPHPARATALDPTPEGARGGALTQRESAEGWGFTPEGSGAHASAVFRRWGFTVKPKVSPSPPPWGYLLNHISKGVGGGPPLPGTTDRLTSG